MTYSQLLILFLGLVLAGIVTMDYTQKNSASGNGFGGSRPFQSIFSLLASYLIIGLLVSGGWMVFDAGAVLDLPNNLTEKLRPATPVAPSVAPALPTPYAPPKPQEQARVAPAPARMITPPVQVPPPSPTVVPRNYPEAPTTYAIPPPVVSLTPIAEPLRGRNHSGPEIFYLIPEGAVSDPAKMLARMRGDKEFHLSFQLEGTNLFKVGYGPFRSWDAAENYRRALRLKNVPLPYQWK